MAFKASKFEFVEISDYGFTRAADDYSGTQNYYGQVCPGCKQMVKCKQTCDRITEMKLGGHVE
jgi:hypothetical protein